MPEMDPEMAVKNAVYGSVKGYVCYRRSLASYVGMLTVRPSCDLRQLVCKKRVSSSCVCPSRIAPSAHLAKDQPFVGDGFAY